MAERYLTDDEWTAEFRPLAAPDGSQMWEHGEVIANNTPSNYVWTWIDGEDGGTYVVSGFHFVNAYAYAVTEEPWLEGDHIEVEIESGADERARYEGEGVS